MMPRTIRLILLAAALALTTGCLPGGGGGDVAAPPSGGEITTTSLAPAGAPAATVAADAPVAGQAQTETEADGAAAEAVTADAVDPAATADPAAAEVAPPPLSPQALACQKRGGRYVATGKGGLHACVQQTRDGGKSCRRETDCEGLCLARSGTCAPIKPVFGCNDIFQADGRRTTLCID